MKRILTLVFAVIIGFSASAQFKASSTVSAATQTKVVASTVDKSDFTGGTSYASTQKAQWDVLFTFNAVEAGSPGIETNGTYFYTTTWNAGNFHRYDMDGGNATTFTVSSIANIRDMAYDGTYFYGSPASMTIYVMDLDNETQIGTITVSSSTGITGVRHIAYDPTLDGGNGGFWVGNWSDLAAIDMVGNSLVANSSTPTMNSAYGSAYDNWTDPANPKLWIATQSGTPSDAVFEEFDINTLTLTGVTHDCTSDLPGIIDPTAILSGGACTYEAGGKFILAGSLQQDPNLVFGYELANTAAQTAPDAPTNFVVAPVDGTNDATISWTNPAVDVAGDPLAELTSVTLLWGSYALYTNTTPVIGGDEGNTYGAFTPGFNTFTVYGTNSNGNGIPSVVTAWIGEDVPAAAGNVTLVDGGSMLAQVSWDAPTAGAHGGYFTGTGLTYDVVRYPGAVLVSDDQAGTTFDETLAVPGNYTYEIIPSNAVGEGEAAMSNSVLFGDFLIFEEFDGTSGVTWTQIGDGASNWMMSSSTNAGGTAPELEFSWTPSFTGESYYVSDIINTSAFLDLNLEFSHFVNYYANGVYVGVYTTSDGGVTWNEAWSISPTGDVGPETQNIVISTPDVGSETFQIAVGFVGYSFDIDYWFVDNFYLSGGTPAVGADITFIVDDGTNPVEGANVLVNGIDHYTDAAGTVTFFVAEGAQAYTVSAFGFQDATGTVTVVDGVPADEYVTLTALPDYTVSFNVENAIADPLNALVTVYYGGMELYTGTATAGTIDFMLPDGDYTYDVVMDGYVSEIGGTFTVASADMDVDVVLMENMNPVTNLDYTQAGGDVSLSWGAPSSISFDPQWIQYDDGINSDGIGTGGAAYFAVAHRYEPADIAEFEGGVISVVEFFPKEAAASYTITVWQGSDVNNLSVVYSELVTSPTIDAYNTITLATEVPIDVTQELWIGYMITTTTGYPAGCDAGPAVAGYGDMIYFGGEWQSMANDIGLDYNWNIHAYVDAPAKGKGFTDTYNVYLNGTLQNATPQSDLFYDFTGLTAGTYTASVTAVYDTGESAEESVEFTVYDAANITFSVVDETAMYTGFALKGSWDADGNYDPTWNGGAEQAMFYDDGTNGDTLAGDGVYMVTVQLMPDGGANSWEWGVNDQDGGWIDGNFPFTVADETAQNLSFTIVGLAQIFADVAISPNPTNGMVNIAANDMYNVQIVDVNGKVISSLDMTSNNATMDISNFEAGLYFVKLSKDGAAASYKIIKK
ncbi:MAG: T9SS type A sorting domain-containing protein [Bacteroidales bacterium]|nr:T9SS type A sorting domain-containing protein [Bacteroidales bacterium]